MRKGIGFRSEDVAESEPSLLLSTHPRPTLNAELSPCSPLPPYPYHPSATNQHPLYHPHHPPTPSPPSSANPPFQSSRKVDQPAPALASSPSASLLPSTRHHPPRTACTTSTFVVEGKCRPVRLRRLRRRGVRRRACAPRRKQGSGRAGRGRRRVVTVQLTRWAQVTRGCWRLDRREEGGALPRCVVTLRPASSRDDTTRAGN